MTSKFRNLFSLFEITYQNLIRGRLAKTTNCSGSFDRGRVGSSGIVVGAKQQRLLPLLLLRKIHLRLWDLRLLPLFATWRLRKKTES